MHLDPDTYTPSVEDVFDIGAIIRAIESVEPDTDCEDYPYAWDKE